MICSESHTSVGCFVSTCCFIWQTALNRQYCVVYPNLREGSALISTLTRLTWAFLQAAVGAVEVYLELASAPARQQQSLKEEEALLANMSLEDQKKHKMKRKKVPA